MIRASLLAGIGILASAAAADVAGGAGGAEAGAGSEREGLLHWKPRGHALGDVHPFFLDGECSLFYLRPDGFRSALARSRDLLCWTETPLTRGPAGPRDRTAPYGVLGGFRDPAAGIYRSFFGHDGGAMASSASADLLRWEWGPEEFSIPPTDAYLGRRDPFVFPIPSSGGYGCVMTTRLKGRAPGKDGAVSLAISPDLRRWRDLGAVLDPGGIGEPECPQMFFLGGRWYILASVHDRAVGRPVYWTSREPLPGFFGSLEARPGGRWLARGSPRFPWIRACHFGIATAGEIFVGFEDAGPF